MNRITFPSLVCTVILSLTPLTVHAEDKTKTDATDSTKKGDRVALVGFETKPTKSNGTIKFFNDTKGFGFISNPTGMSELIKEVAVICGGPTTGCTFEIIDWLNRVLYGIHNSSDSADCWHYPFLNCGGTPGIIDEINEGDKVSFNEDANQNESNAPKTGKKSKVKFKAGSDLAGKVN